MDRRELAAVDGVRAFVVALGEIRSRLFAGWPDVDGVADLHVAVRSTRVLPREGRSPTGIDYCVHGAGCRMTDERGREVDIDVVDDVEAFDGYRIRAFLAADDERRELPSAGELRRACARLAAAGEIREVRPGLWWALPA